MNKEKLAVFRAKLREKVAEGREIIFTDETIFSLKKCYGFSSWSRKGNPNYIYERVHSKGSANVSCIGAISNSRGKIKHLF